MRLLLADDVGLGKTIQAGLVVAELRARGAADRVLILTPAGLREQWARELSERFAIDANAVDGRVLRRRTTMLPVGVNPWSTLAVAIASVDYVKRTEVLPAVTACSWDVVIVDEAHGVALDSDRRAAVHALASRATCVLLLTATPHNGDRRAFDALCALGAIDSPDDPPLVVFRRTRRDVGIGTTRRIHTIAVSPSAAERRMHRLLGQLRRRRPIGTARSRPQRCAASRSRCCTSARSRAPGRWHVRSSDACRCSLSATVAVDAEQLALPLGDPYGDLVAADEPPAWPADLRLSDTRREHQLLTTLASSAVAASRHESKLAALWRLLRRA